MTSEIHRKFIEPRRSMTLTGLLSTLHGKLLYVYITNWTARLVTVPNPMIVVSTSNTPICIMHLRGKEQYVLNNKDLLQGNAKRLCTNPIINSVLYRSLGTAIRKCFNTMLWRYYIGFPKHTVAKNKWYPMNVLGFATNILEWSYSSMTGGTDTSGTSAQYGSESNSRRLMNILKTQCRTE